jgi:flagellar hook-associated protein 2
MTTTPVSFGGLESGLNTSEIISAEMQVFEQPLDALQTRQSALNTQISDYQAINSASCLTLQQSADALADPVAYDEAFSASSSNSSIATGTISSGSQAGSVTLAVDQLATGSTQISQGTVASTDDVVASGTILVGSGGAALGLASITAGSGLAVGAHSISVTQASAGATVAAATPLAASTTISGANDEIDVDVDGSPLSVTIAAGTYTPAQLAQAITQGSGGALSASVSSGGQFVDRHHPAGQRRRHLQSDGRVGPRRPRSGRWRHGLRDRRNDRRGRHHHHGQRYCREPVRRRSRSTRVTAGPSRPRSQVG